MNYTFWKWILQFRTQNNYLKRRYSENYYENGFCCFCWGKCRVMEFVVNSKWFFFFIVQIVFSICKKLVKIKKKLNKRKSFSRALRSCEGCSHLLRTSDICQRKFYGLWGRTLMYKAPFLKVVWDFPFRALHLCMQSAYFRLIFVN